MEEKYLTVQNIAERFSVHKITVRRWIRAKRLKAYRVGHQYRITEQDLQVFLNSPAK